MNNIKILVGLTVLAIYGVTASHSLRCYGCSSEQSCRKPSQVECSPSYANATRTYLAVFHSDVNMDATSKNFDCFREYINGSFGEIYYKGCIYANTDGCSLPLRSIYEIGKTARNCKQCNNKNGCNPAGRAELHYGLPVVVLIFAVFGKFVWNN